MGVNWTWLGWLEVNRFQQNPGGKIQPDLSQRISFAFFFPLLFLFPIPHHSSFTGRSDPSCCFLISHPGHPSHGPRSAGEGILLT